jgi:hypothetical protein
MQIKYSKHLEIRLELRSLDYDLPKHILTRAEEKYFDKISGYNIAVKKVSVYGKKRDVMLAYTYEGDIIKLLTIHPLKEGQKENRIKSGRWRELP